MAYIRTRGKQKRIEIVFTYKGVRRYEKTEYLCVGKKKPCKCINCRQALSIAEEIEIKIFNRTFVYKEYFPNSKKLYDIDIAQTAPDIKFSSYAWQWLDLKERSVAYSTYKGYLSIIRKLVDYFGDTELINIKYSHIQAYIKKDTTKPKTISNTANVLQQIFESAIIDDIISKNPVEFIKKPRIQIAQVDPFDRSEAIQIINWMEEKHPHIAIFFALGFYTGMRTGELLALKWSDIDFQSHKIKVQRTITKSRIKESTKTSEYRIIDIIPALDPHLKRHKQYTFMKSEWVLNTSYGKPFMKTENMKVYYNPCLKALGLRFRNVYQMRHSFACMMIEAGEDLNWIKNMLGHNTLEMLFKRYGNRINREESTRRGLIISDLITEQTR
ncbi:MAG: site-specific integrase [Geovibrio sp.]|jgi:integrase|nr:site-specific integrase [Geovibrio sp.]MCD8569775.1 site-specific integrase [Geovibrio sp.]